jgi:cytochrome c biogenesis protein CcmG, thiol:disulfide interchange protein DsbE
MNRQWWYVGLVVALVLVLIGMGWLVRDRFRPVEVGTTAPDFPATDLDGNTVRLSDLRGEVVLLNIWATWCPPCIEELPSMQRLYDSLGPEGLRIVAVSVDAPLGLFDRRGQPGGNVEQFVQRFGLTFDIWRDPTGTVERAYRTTAVPESFVIDRDGMIVRKVIGAFDWDSEASQELVTRLLRQ